MMRGWPGFPLCHDDPHLANSSHSWLLLHCYQTHTCHHEYTLAEYIGTAGIFTPMAAHAFPSQSAYKPVGAIYLHITSKDNPPRMCHDHCPSVAIPFCSEMPGIFARGCNVPSYLVPGCTRILPGGHNYTRVVYIERLCNNDVPIGKNYVLISVHPCDGASFQL